MKVIVIGAGRGQRLMPMTEDAPKCFAPIHDRRILDYALHAFAENGIDDICFVGGYQIDKVRREYPQFRFVHNRDWPNNNILGSLMHAEAEMDDPFICCYSDILFTPKVVTDLLNHPADISLVVDNDWLARYAHRTQHPTDDGEKVIVAAGLVQRIHRDINECDAFGEFIGVAKFSRAGAETLREHYHRCRAQYAGKPFRDAPVFEKAYLIALFQEMVETGVELSVVETRGGYMEIDTQEDYDLARRFWKGA